MRTRETLSTKNTNINIRVAPAQRDLIDRAARVKGKTRSEFILDVVAREAENTLLDQQLFLLDETQWETFTAILDAPVRHHEALRSLMTTPAPWD
jgi:uncharacterized protein (DUF1778 family)